MILLYSFCYNTQHSKRQTISHLTPLQHTTTKHKYTNPVTPHHYTPHHTTLFQLHTSTPLHPTPHHYSTNSTTPPSTTHHYNKPHTTTTHTTTHHTTHTTPLQHTTTTHPTPHTTTTHPTPLPHHTPHHTIPTRGGGGSVRSMSQGECLRLSPVMERQRAIFHSGASGTRVECGLWSGEVKGIVEWRSEGHSGVEK
ncbi:hypothetical protein Pcinc_003994 [Petrolisthes cinctipes]|uniref:Uncharacterized protein n=1 Tax=Petrolisthes cinctipes TaxID=88211 RepID=A0AAE1GG71_PETCI|nr:hypothetical protein Pcinc_003994 [Petrolisthes cinctipes]